MFKSNHLREQFAEPSFKDDAPNVIAKHPLLPYVLIAINDVSGAMKSYIPSSSEMEALGVYVNEENSERISQLEHTSFTLESAENWISESTKPNANQSPQSDSRNSSNVLRSFGSDIDSDIALKTGVPDKNADANDLHRLNNESKFKNEKENKSIRGDEAENRTNEFKGQATVSKEMKRIKDGGFQSDVKSGIIADEEKATDNSSILDKRSADSFMLSVLIYLEAERRMLTSVHAAAAKLRMQAAGKVVRLFSSPVMGAGRLSPSSQLSHLSFERLPQESAEEEVASMLSVANSEGAVKDSRVDDSLNFKKIDKDRQNNTLPSLISAASEAITGSNNQPLLSTKNRPRFVLDNFAFWSHPDLAETPRSYAPAQTSGTVHTSLSDGGLKHPHQNHNMNSLWQDQPQQKAPAEAETGESLSASTSSLVLLPYGAASESDSVKDPGGRISSQSRSQVAQHPPSVKQLQSVDRHQHQHHQVS